MAHKASIKAYAIALLMTGDSPRFVSHETSVPLTTIKRWRNHDMKQLLRWVFPHGVATGLQRGRGKMAPKKGETPDNS